MYSKILNLLLVLNLSTFVFASWAQSVPGSVGPIGYRNLDKPGAQQVFQDERFELFFSAAPDATFYEYHLDGALLGTSNTNAFAHSFALFGNYPVEVRGCNDAGCGPVTSRMVNINVVGPMLQGLASPQFVGEAKVLTWSTDLKSAEYLVLQQIDGGGWVSLGAKTTDTNVTLGTYEQIGKHCFYVHYWASGYKQQRNGGGNVQCTHISMRGTLASQSPNPIRIAHDDTYTLSTSGLTFSPAEMAPYVPVRLESGQHYTVSGDGMTLTPDPDYFGPVTIKAIFKDKVNLETGVINISGEIYDARPVALNQPNLNINYKGELLYIGPYMAGSADPRGLDIVATRITQHPRYGLVNITHGGKNLEYRNHPNSGYLCATQDSFTDTFQYAVTNSAGLESLPATATVRVNCHLPRKPVALGDVLNYPPDTTCAFDLVDPYVQPKDENGNPIGERPAHLCVGSEHKDFDHYGLEVNLHAITQPPYHGSLTVVGNEIIYSPKPGICETDWFYYTIVNSEGVVSEPVLSRVECGETPFVEDDEARLSIGQSINIDVLANDVNVNYLPVIISAIITQPNKGTVTISDDARTVFYQHNGLNCPLGTVVEDTFEYQISNAVGNDSVPAKVTLRIYCLSITWSPDSVYVGQETLLSWQIGSGITCQNDSLDQALQLQGEIAKTFYQPTDNAGGEWQCFDQSASQLLQFTPKLEVEKLPYPGNLHAEKQ